MLDGGNFVTKVIYLPDPRYQELAVSGVSVETLVSTRLEPGIDPILEADKRGTILLIVRLGAIDLEMPGGGNVLGGGVPTPAGGPAMGNVPGGAPMTPGGPGITELPPGTLPPGTVPPAPAGTSGTVVLDPPAAGAVAPPSRRHLRRIRSRVLPRRQFGACPPSPLPRRSRCRPCSHRRPTRPRPRCPGRESSGER